ncbi:MAG: N-formylglutamate amidohydrolase [Gammaproteobacteria bacterium]
MQLSAKQGTASLLSVNDPDVSRTLNPDSTSPLLLVCDHASNRVPEKLDNLGLDEASLSRHIAFDKGSAAVAERVSADLGCSAVLCNFSRLVIDCNRKVGDPTLMPPVSDDVFVPGNQNLTEVERAARYDDIYVPYHDAITNELNRLEDQVQGPAIIAIHSFTPQLEGGDWRPWDVGVLWDKDSRIASPLLEYLRADSDLCVGDNEPYSGKHPADYTIDFHGEERGIPCVSIEIRQDLLSTQAGIEGWARRLIGFFKEFEKNRDVFTKLQ